MNHIKEFQLKHGLGSDGIIGRDTLSKMREVWGISKEQLSHFIGQIHHETGGFKADTENLNYSSVGLSKTFPKYFGAGKMLTFGYANNPEKIANYVYANRMGNGNEASGDGWKYRGRGSLQLTGKENYERFAKWLKITMLCPDDVATKYYWETALFYFATHPSKLWTIAQTVSTATITKISKATNGGTNGLDDRIAKTNYYYKLQK